MVVRVVFLNTCVESVSTVNIIWVLVFLILFYLFMTMYCTPYNALISEFGKTQDDRMFISTAISLTFFFGTLIAYLPFVFAGPLQQMVSYAWSYRIWFIVLAAVALVCLLVPVLKLHERDFVDAEPSESNAFRSLSKTFQNKDFRRFSASDIAYWIGLTLFQTGLPFFVKVSMELDEFYTTVFLGAMTVLSACFYPLVSKLVAKHGKKKLVILGFLGLALAYIITALIGVIPGLNGIIPGIRGCGGRGRHPFRRKAGGHVLRRPDLRDEIRPVACHAGLYLPCRTGNRAGSDQQRSHRLPHRSADRRRRRRVLLHPRCCDPFRL